MIGREDLLELIRKSVQETAPDATVILYGSYARGDFHENSDVDLLILLDKENITREDEKAVKYPLYDIEFETGRIISPLVLAKKDWIKRKLITPFYENVIREGQEL